MGRPPSVDARRAGLNGSVYAEHTFNQSGTFAGLVTVGGQRSELWRSPDVGGTGMTSHTDTVVNKKGKMPWYVYFIEQRSILLLPVGCSQNRLLWHDLRHQCTIGVLLCLGGLETREAKQR